MRTFFILCTAVTILQVFDVYITGISAGASSEEVVDPLAATPVKNDTRAVKKTKATKPVKPAAAVAPEADQATGSNQDDDSDEADPPKTVKDSGKRVVQTIKKVASKRTVGILNGFNGLLKTAGKFDFFGKFIRNQSNNVKAVATDSLKLLSDFGDSSSKGARNVLESSRTIGKEGGKVLYSTLQKATDLGKNLTKLGGTALGTPISVGGDFVGTANRLAKAPSYVSKLVTSKAINPALSFMESKSEADEEEDKEDEEEDKPKSTPTQTTKKQTNKKTTK